MIDNKVLMVNVNTFDAEIDLWENTTFNLEHTIDQSAVENPKRMDNIFDEDLRVVIFIRLGFL